MGRDKLARIRTIKPEFWTDGKIVSLSCAARLMFIGTWNFARCDKGHIDDDPLGLKLKILPVDKVDANKVVEELIKSGLIDRFQFNDRTYLKIKRFSEHQKVDSRWENRCPYCLIESENSCEKIETHRNSPKLTETPMNSPQERKGEEGKGRESKVKDGSYRHVGKPDAPKAPDLESFILSLKTNPAYKGINIDRELSKMDAWLQTPNGRRRQKTKGFVLNWLNRIDQPLEAKNSLQEWLQKSEEEEREQERIRGSHEHPDGLLHHPPEAPT